MKRAIILSVLMVMVMALFTGCASVWSINASKTELATERILASGDTDVINAMRMGVPPRKALQAIKIQPLADGQETFKV